jgi:hypothetical protein
MKTYNTTPPKEASLTTTFSIGWEHEIVDGAIVLTLDGDGQPLARSYTVPTRATAQVLMDAVALVGGPEILQTLASDGGVAAVVELVGAVVGKDTLMAIAADPTVETASFMELVVDLASALGLDEAVPGAGPTEAPAGA